MEFKQSEQILEGIILDIKARYGIQVNDVKELDGGYANLKWKVGTDDGELFIKQFDRSRYPAELMPGLEVAMGLQHTLQERGIPCPRLFPRDDRYIQYTSAGERYVITEYCQGNVLQPGAASAAQMGDLGAAIGRMHLLFAQHAPSGLPLHWRPATKAAALDKWSQNWEEARRLGAEKYLSALETQRAILDHFDPVVFESCEEGWVHWDLFMDNLLFHDKSLSAILDFDRLNYIYPEFDLSRPLLSGSIGNQQLNVKTAQAFMAGYRESVPVSGAKLARAIKLTWWKEAAWFNVYSDNFTTLSRFVDELIWINNHWAQLEDIFDEL
ncbi:hypothetical protein EBB07_04475 [Paenibacillaceae bacterium]|nr:hypothetical protein EBB07_04475 [Paenibacillaceae bacterium]